MNHFDIFIRNAKIVDGSGNPWYRGDLAIKEGKVAAVGRVDDLPASELWEVAGRVVCPGFIDMHTHSDLMLLANPRHEPKVRQGITTEVIGHDGLSYAPVSAGTLDYLRKTLRGLNGNPEGLSWKWRRVAEYLAEFDGNVSVNVAFLLPHGPLRLLTARDSQKPIRGARLRGLQQLVAEGMEEGAVGFSTGLTYSPCAFADEAELEACCEVVAQYGGFYAPHLRSYGDGFITALEDAFELCRRTGVPLHLTHLHASFPVNRDKAATVLNMIDEARASGLDVTLDSYPYTAGSTFLAGLLPAWTQNSSSPVAELFKSRQARERIDREMAAGCDGFSGVPVDWSIIVLAGIESAEFAWAGGLSVEAAASRVGQRPVDFVCDLLLAEDLNVSCVLFIGYEENVQTIMKHPAHMVGSDGLLAGKKPHPRTYGTFPRYLGRYVRELGVLKLEDCIRKMTSLPAQRLGLRDRGLLRPGMAADVVILDPEEVIDTSTYENPTRHPLGISDVIVNGIPVIRTFEHTGRLPGRSLGGRPKRFGEPEVSAKGVLR